MSLTNGLEHIVIENEPLAQFTRLRLGGVAEYFAQPTSAEELQDIIHRCNNEHLPIRLLGGGSNVLISDEGVPGMVVHLAAPAFSQIKVLPGGLSAGGGAMLSHFVSTAVREGFSGPDQLVGIPGTVGGALHENTGTATADIGTWAEAVVVMTQSGEILERSRDELNFSYRQSSLNELVIWEARFKFDSEDPVRLTKRLQKLWIARRAHQPMSQENSAYVFKDHGGESAGKLIDLAGLKATRVGQVEISSRNSNFIVANPGATSGDVKRLIDLIRSRVKDRLGIDLELGLRIW
jgi:UDP-N-acetylmuramate dehydrogenase